MNLKNIFYFFHRLIYFINLERLYKNGYRINYFSFKIFREMKLNLINARKYSL